jgi:hypothetical protein
MARALPKACAVTGNRSASAEVFFNQAGQVLPEMRQR